MASSRASSGYSTTQERPATGASSHTSETTGLFESSNDAIRRLRGQVGELRDMLRGNMASSSASSGCISTQARPASGASAQTSETTGLLHGSNDIKTLEGQIEEVRNSMRNAIDNYLQRGDALDALCDRDIGN